MSGLAWLSAPVRALCWTLGIHDGHGVPSLSKGLALAFAVTIGRDVWLHSATATNVSAMALLCSVAFGRAVFVKWLDRNAWTGTATTTTTVDAAKVIDAIAARRDHTKGVEPSP